jgi:putative phosphoribosyl transferase
VGELLEDPVLRDRRHPFRDRSEAGRALAEAIAPQVRPGTVVLAIPPGGVPIAHEIAARHALPLGLFFTERLVMPNGTEGFGAIAMGGVSALDRRAIDRSGLAPRELRRLRRQKLEAIKHRARSYGALTPEVEGKAVVLVDEGMVSGRTMLAAVKTLRRGGARTILVAVPTAPTEAILRLINEVDTLYCLNVRKDDGFDIPAAYSEQRGFGEPEAHTLWVKMAEEGQSTRNPYHTVQSSSGIPYDR